MTFESFLGDIVLLCIYQKKLVFIIRRRHNNIDIVYLVYLTPLHVSAVHVLPDDG